MVILPEFDPGLKSEVAPAAPAKTLDAPATARGGSACAGTESVGDCSYDG